MAFKKANPDYVKEENIRGTKGYIKPKIKRPRKKPGPKAMTRKIENRKGPLTKVEHIAAEALVTSVDENESPEQIEHRSRALAIALRRTPQSMRESVEAARQRIVDRLPLYADLHLQAAINAAAEGNSKPAEWALERATTKDDKDKVMRVVEPLKQETTQSMLPVINIGIQMGGIAPGASMMTEPDVDIDFIDVEEDGEP